MKRHPLSSHGMVFSTLAHTQHFVCLGCVDFVVAKKNKNICTRFVCCVFQARGDKANGNVLNTHHLETYLRNIKILLYRVSLNYTENRAVTSIFLAIFAVDRDNCVKTWFFFSLACKITQLSRKAFSIIKLISFLKLK